MQKDPFAGRLDLPTSITSVYSYVSCNPANLRDPSGRFFESLGIGGVFGGIVSGVGNIVSNIPGIGPILNDVFQYLAPRIAVAIDERLPQYEAAASLVVENRLSRWGVSNSAFNLFYLGSDAIAIALGVVQIVAGVETGNLELIAEGGYKITKAGLRFRSDEMALADNPNNTSYRSRNLFDAGDIYYQGGKAAF